MGWSAGITSGLLVIRPGLWQAHQGMEFAQHGMPDPQGVCGAANTTVCVRPNISEAKLRPLARVVSSGVWYAFNH